MKILVSIIVPTFNEEKTIKQSLYSFRKQCGKNCEVIVCDAYSTDATVKIAGKYADKIVFEKKRTIGAGRQTGARNSRGEFLVFADADSVAPTGWLGKLLSSFKDERIVAAHGNLLPLDGNAFEEIVCRTLLPLYFAFMTFIGKPSGAGNNLAVRKTAFWKVKGFNTSMVTCEDLDLERKLLSLGRVVFNSNAFLRVSMRRVRKWGYLNYAWFQLKNALQLHLLGKAEEKYAPVR